MNYKKVFGLLLIGLIILAGMIIFIGPGEIFDAINKTNKNYVILAVVIQFVVMILSNLRWSFISNSLGVIHNRLSLFAMLLFGYAVNNITPSGRGGGEPVRAYLLSKSSGDTFDRTFATVVGDRFFDLFPFVIMSILAVLYLIFTLHLGQSMFLTLILALALLIALLVFVLYLCFNESLGIRVIKWVFRVVDRFTSRNIYQYESRVLEALIEFQTSLKYLLKNKSLFIVSMIIAFTIWILELLRVYIVFLAFGVNVSLGMIASVFLVSALVGMIPALPGGLGAVEGVMFFLYSLAGIPTSISTAASLIERAISFWMVSILGLATLPYFGTGVLDKAGLD